MTNLATRLKAARKKAGKTQLEVATKVGISQPAYQALETGRNQKSAYLASISEYLGVELGWLLNGEGKADKSINITPSSNISTIDTAVRRIPLLDYVQAGLFHDVGYDGINSIGDSYTTYQGYKPECVFALRVEGLSMAPDFLPGDELIVDASLEAKPGSLVIAQEIQHGIARTTFKKYRVIGVNEFGVDVIELVPLNPDYPTYNSTQIEISIIGVVVAHNRTFKY